MANIVLKAENISKQYRLGQLGTGTISHDINRWWHKARGKEDPYLKLGDSNDRSVAGGSQYVWSLKDINFEVKQGEVVGIIGKNGAGKSTLLKVLSQVTTPTTGEVKIKGRIAALLEVGTGFHPDLSGRENIFLNGAILGMTKAEIKSKLEEIVDFSGIAKYLDTPVKRYSSGMMVRLGFAIAAHLEPEILIVDEVLAVGDAEFQKKCLGKMKDVSSQGRTVLFVSHNMAAVKSLCDRGILLINGKLDFDGTQTDAVDRYHFMHINSNGIEHHGPVFEAIGNDSIRIMRLNILPRKGETLSVFSGIDIVVNFYNSLIGKNIDVTIEVETFDNVVVFHNGTIVTENNDSDQGIYFLKFGLPEKFLNAGKYLLSITFGENQRHVLYHQKEIISFEVYPEASGSNSSVLPGIIIPTFNTEKSFKKN
ncbi:MAG: ATP-binding cassette protein [Bacteroidetes bacterium]|nr:ATP-binding cassette protein [Bacteroidota bacterium]